MSSFLSINPWNGEILQEYPSTTPEAVEKALALAEHCFDSWRSQSSLEKSYLFRQLAQLLRARKEELARLISLEVGKVISESRAEIEKCALVCEFYAERVDEFLAPESIILPDQTKAKVIFQASGIILAIMPWNFPFWQVFRFAVPTLIAGNVGVLKHASNVPQCALAIQRLFKEAGFPPGCFQSLLLDGPSATALLDDPRIKGVSLTGSEKAGATVAAAAGKNLKKSLLELGGSDPFIVLADADLPLAASTAVKARMVNFGQSCIAAKRFIIEEPVYDAFVELFLQELKKLRPGNPLDEQASYACMARPDLAAELYQQVRETVALGARVLIGCKAPEPGSAIFEPTVLENIPEGSPAFSEELFGPVASLFKVASFQEAIALANATEYGLGASIWTTNPRADFAVYIESGVVFLNAQVASHPMLPFGGIKKSGYGRELSKQGILEFVNLKTIYLG
ncbi:MAG: NAD-dependent succinate-semialdehyde dehydrogenase [Bacteroidetes bacterium]|nr:NAD-dependent succinate-semialdehyde dehydrogenase [Bacteroidota bacterium]